MPKPDLFHRSPDGELWVNYTKLVLALTEWAEEEDAKRDKADRAGNEFRSVQNRWAAINLRNFRDSVKKLAADVPPYVPGDDPTD